MLSVKITNALCNLQCAYCYEHVYRERANHRPLDLEAVLTQIEREQTAPYLHGGEALLAPLDVVEAILAKSYEKIGHSSIQTNATLINEKHIELFKLYKTQVGVSFDGPGEMSRYRIPVENQGKGHVSDLIWENIKWLRREGIQVGIICVLTKANALPEQREAFKRWVLELKELGITGRMNPAEIDYPSMQKIALTPEELDDFYRDMTRFILTEVGGDWLPYRDIVDSLLGLNQGTCSFGPCDYYNAGAERVILSDGSTASCMKTSKTGNIYPRFQNAGDRGFGLIRYEILPKIEQKLGGCKGCQYWRNCTGGCPAEGIDGDWRNRSRYCLGLKGLFEETSRLLKTMLPNIELTTDRESEAFSDPNSVKGMNPDAFCFMSTLSNSRASSWRQDARVSLSHCRQTTQPLPQSPPEDDCGHGDRQHGDRAHGDHGDHGDSWKV